MKYQSIYLTMVLLLVVILVASAFALPLGYSYDETCPECQGAGKVTCRSCGGSGICYWCSGTGDIWYMPEYSNWCAACQGTGICSTCDGKGWFTCSDCLGTGIVTRWIYNLVGSTVAFSIINVLLFLGLFAFSYAASAFYLGFNEWVNDVDDMGFLFNPSFMTWLFAKHRDRWAKWQTGLNVLFAVYFGAFLFLSISSQKISQDAFVNGGIIGFAILVLFSLLFYKAYVTRIQPRDEIDSIHDG